MRKEMKRWLAAVLMLSVFGGAVAVSAAELPDAATETYDNYYVYQTDYYYSGSGNVNEYNMGTADLQPGESIDIKLSTNSDFKDGTYTLTTYSCGNRESYEIKVNGKSVGTITRAGTGFGQNEADMSYDKLSVTLKLKATDTLTITAPNDGTYGWMDFIILDKGDTTADVPDDPGENTGSTGTGTAKATETGDGYFLYQAEGFYSGSISEGVAADLQPGESIEFDLSANSDFVAGTYTLTVRSCGNRTMFTVKVNDEIVDLLVRTGTNFGQDQMTDDRLSTVLELKPGDKLTISGQSGEYWGWVDYIKLNEVQAAVGEATETGDGYFVYQAEFFFSQLAADATVADLPAGATLDIPLNQCPDFVEGWYTITVAACGSRETLYLRLNGESIGSVSYLSTACSLDKMTEKMRVKLYLDADDVLTLAAPNDGTNGWVDYVRLDAKDPPAGSTTVTEPVTEPTQTQQPTQTTAQPAEDPQPNSALPIVLAAAAVVLAGGAAVIIMVARRKKNGK